ncbi:formate dehydrogenase subunit delta [Maritalea mobilis]|uniref:Formate dehydrogenase delta subunit n=1 Tax=[Roseibacterium] beibuensis TaxID=1193142 RepID=A0ABP9KZ53_9RHOB|nr:MULTISPECIES: formate dehydrogenase subunit delta [Alphaproteobacteria]MBY6200614.1 formate dehydrogenase subunit delta [Maritalea mobilis]MCS6621666.1 formate dehydrogenase subunit delta [Roseibacterium beibuensis]
MSPDKLVRMANQIATFFHSQPGQDQAERVAGHLKDFWGPEMREELKVYAQKGHDKDLDVLVRRALPMI